jgi:hypothetical protein
MMPANSGLFVVCGSGRGYCVRPIEEDNAGKICTIVAGKPLDRAVSNELLRIVAPLGIEAAIDTGTRADAEAVAREAGGDVSARRGSCCGLFARSYV